MKEAILQLDKNIFFFFQGLRHPGVDYILGWPTVLGGTVLCLTLVLLGVLIFDRSGSRRKIPAVVVGILGANWITEWMKHVFARPRPFLFWENITVLFERPANHSFPSGHSAVIFAAAFLLSHFYGRKMRWMYAAAVWVAVTRLYVGVHYPTDLIAGAMVGTAWAYLTCRFVRFYAGGASAPQ